MILHQLEIYRNTNSYSINLLHSFKLIEQQLIIILSITGQLTEACVSLQRELDRALLWFACRRHTGEVMLTDCWDSLKIEASSCPNI